MFFNDEFSRRTFLSIVGALGAECILDSKKVHACTQAMGPKSNYPTVIIGAGLGGLCCGAYLAKNGIPVTIVEQHTKPGGYATSFRRGSGKFTFEVSLHATVINNNNAARILDDLGVLDQISLAELPEFYSLKAPGYDIYTMPERDPEAFITILSSRFPGEAAGIRSFVELILDATDEFNLLNKENPTMKGISTLFSFPFKYPNIFKLTNKTIASTLSKYVNDSTLKEILGSLWSYCGLPPSKLPAIIYAGCLGDYMKNGSYYIKDRSQNLSNALAQTITSSGGSILYSTKAENILVEDNKVKGVKLSDGKVLPARAVVSNASAITTFKQMLPPSTLPAKYMRKIDSYKPSISMFVVWLGLNRDITDIMHHTHVYVGNGQDSETMYTNLIKGDIENMGFGVSFHDNIFPGYSNPGSSTVMITVPCGYEPWKRFESDYKAGNKNAYNIEKWRWADILIRKAEEMVLPGLSSMIEVKEASTPLTNWRFTGNTNGAVYGFEWSMLNSGLYRIDNRTPVNGLYLAGAWGSPGGGYTSVLASGQNTFMKMLEDWCG